MGESGAGGVSEAGAGGEGEPVVVEHPHGTVGSATCSQGALCPLGQHCVQDTCVATPCQVAPRFGALVNVPVGAGPADLAAADFNGDGTIDLAVPVVNDDDVEVLLNAGGALLTVGRTYPVQQSPSSIGVIDVNGDDYPDLAVASDLSDTVRVLVNIGDGAFVAGVSYAAPNGPTNIHGYDVNEDGLDDLVYVTSYDGKAAVRLGDGAGHFAAPLFTVLGDGARGLEIADLDGDEHPDLVVALAAGVKVAWGLGDGHFALDAQVVPDTGGQNPRFGNDTLALADMDGDDAVDVVTYLPSSRVGFVHNAGHRVLSPAKTLFADSSSGQLVVSDLNADGHPDVGVAYYDGTLVRAALNDGAGSFSNTTYPVGLHPVALLAADLTGDGKPDLVSADFDSRSVSVLANDGSGVFPSSADARHSIGSNIASVCTADWDGNGTADVGVTTLDGLQTFLGQGDGNFSGGGGGADFSPDATIAAYLDGDAGMEVVSLRQVGTVVHVQRSSGKQEDYPVPWGRRLFSGDFNADGFADVAVSGELHQILVLLNNGYGKLRPALATDIDQNDTPVLAADMNGDGASDVVVSNSLGWPMVWLNDGSGKFSPPSFIAELDAGSFEAADFDADGTIDLAVWEQGRGPMNVFLNDGTATFVKAHKYPNLREPRAHVSGDFNSDGLVDIAGVDGDTLTLLLNVGAGGFQPSQTYRIGDSAGALASADFNTDGRPDLVLLNSGAYPNMLPLLNVCLPSP